MTSFDSMLPDFGQYVRKADLNKLQYPDIVDRQLEEGFRRGRAWSTEDFNYFVKGSKEPPVPHTVTALDYDVLSQGLEDDLREFIEEDPDRPDVWGEQLALDAATYMDDPSGGFGGYLVAFTMAVPEGDTEMHWIGGPSGIDSLISLPENLSDDWLYDLGSLDEGYRKLGLLTEDPADLALMTGSVIEEMEEEGYDFPQEFTEGFFRTLERYLEQRDEPY